MFVFVLAGAVIYSRCMSRLATEHHETRAKFLAVICPGRVYSIQWHVGRDRVHIRVHIHLNISRLRLPGTWRANGI